MGPVTKQDLTDLKTLLNQLNEKITELDEKVSKNHEDILTRISVIEDRSKEALVIAQKNESEIFDLHSKQETMKNEIYNEISKRFNNQNENIQRIEYQLKAAMIELEDLRNRSMRSTLIFKHI